MKNVHYVHWIVYASYNGISSYHSLKTRAREQNGPVVRYIFTILVSDLFKLVKYILDLNQI